MLQILSGKFFSGQQINEQESDAVLYSNFAWIAPIHTSVAELRPVDPYSGNVSAYVVRYKNRYEPTSPRDPMIFGSADEAVDQFRLLCSFWFKAFFHVDRNYVELLCRQGRRHSWDTTVPREFVPRFFDAQNRGNPVLADGFVGFVDKVLGIQRKQYLLFIACLRAFFDALEALGSNFDLAYSMFVYLLEALCQSSDEYVPTWNDFDQAIRDRLEQPLASIEPATANEIQSILLESTHLKLMKRFVEFVTSHLSDDFFAGEAHGIARALPRSDLAQALRKLYGSRSGYVHELREVHEHLRIPQIQTSADYVTFDNEPYLTLSGLVRIAHHVLTQFVHRQPTMTTESLPSWRQELPGVAIFEMAPQYWIWQTDGFTPKDSKKRFSGFMQHFAANRDKAVIPLPDMRNLMERIEQLAAQAKLGDRLPMLALYWMYNGMLPEEYRRPKWEIFMSRYKSDAEECSIELLSAFTVAGRPIGWSVSECVAVFEQYRRAKYKPASINLPTIIEIAVASEIANLYLDAGRLDDFKNWVDQAFYDGAGKQDLQNLLAACKHAAERINIRRVLGRPQGRLISVDDIRLCAYFKWEAAGRPEGDGVSFWLEAQRELQQTG